MALPLLALAPALASSTAPIAAGSAGAGAAGTAGTAGTAGALGGSAALKGPASISPWASLGSGILGAIGTGLTAYQQAEAERKRLEEERKRFEHQQKMDYKGQFNTERQLGQGAIGQLSSGFREALYRALTR